MHFSRLSLLALVAFVAGSAHATDVPPEFELLREQDLASICYLKLTGFGLDNVRFATGANDLRPAAQAFAFASYWFGRAQVSGTKKSEMEGWVSKMGAEPVFDQRGRFRYCFETAKLGMDAIAPQTRERYFREAAQVAEEEYRSRGRRP